MRYAKAAAQAVDDPAAARNRDGSGHVRSDREPDWAAPPGACHAPDDRERRADVDPVFGVVRRAARTRLPEEIAAQETLFPSESAIQFGYREAVLSADLSIDPCLARGREIDLAIAACAIARQAQFWTLNIANFKDIPGLRLVRAARSAD